jgi:hypothetical protein
METNNLNLDNLYKNLKKENLAESKNLLNYFPKQKISHFDNIQKQRHFQRRILFWFAIITTSLSILALVGIISCQIYLRTHGQTTLKILDGYELEIISIGVVAQFIGVIVVITKSLWDDTPYKETLAEN